MSDIVVNKAIFAACDAENPCLPTKAWLRHWQDQQRELFLKRGFPTTKVEQWKYTDVSRLLKQNYDFSKPVEISSLVNDKLENRILLVFLNGHFSERLSDLSLVPNECIITPLSQAIQNHENLLKPHLLNDNSKYHSFANLNASLMTDGAFISIPKNTALDIPIHCLFLNTQQTHFITCPRNIIILEANSQATILEEYAGFQAENYFTNVITTLHAENNSQLHYHKIQAEQASATHIAALHVTQKQNSMLKTYNLSKGSQLARDDIFVASSEPGASCQLSGFYHLTNDGQLIDHHLQVDHTALHGSSTMLYKGILNQKSRAVFNGKVIVHPGAQQIAAHQFNHNLLLSPFAEINTKPELEVYADDIKCTHGATVGQLDSESLFYLRARGIDEADAKEILTRAFAEDTFHQITNSSMREYIQMRAYSL